MSKHPGVDQTLALIESLKGAVCDFASREEKLKREFETKLTYERQCRDEAAEETAGQLAGELERQEARHQSIRGAAESNFRARKTRVSQAHKASQRDALDRIEANEGRRKHKLQTETLQSRRTRETELAQAETTLGEFKQKLAEEDQALAVDEFNARRAFGGYRRFLRYLSNPPNPSEPDLGPDEYQLLEHSRQLLNRTRADLGRFGRLPLPWLFRFWAVWLVLLCCVIPMVPLLRSFGVEPYRYDQAISVTVAGLVIGLILYFLGLRQGTSPAGAVAGSFHKVRLLHQACGEKSGKRHEQELARIEKEFQDTTRRIEHDWNAALEEAAELRNSYPQILDQKALRAAAKCEKGGRLRLDKLDQDNLSAVERLKQRAEARQKEIAERCAAREAKLQADLEGQWQPLETEWKARTEPVYEAVQATNEEAGKLFPAWETGTWADWAAPQEFGHVTKFARLDVDVKQLAEMMPQDARLALPGPGSFSLPLFLLYPNQGSVLFETTNTGREEVIGALNNIILRLLSTAPPGRLSFSIIDPVGLGQSFSGVMHLADYAEHLINSRIWTQTSQIEQRLADLNEHMEKVIQMYLRNEYATIAEYNKQAGNIAEKYHFLVVADFPSNFSDVAARRLLSVASSGARCGVYTLIHWDRRQPLPQDFVPEELRQSSVCVSCKGNRFMLTGKFFPGTNLVLDPAPDPEFATEFIQRVGLTSRDSNRVEVPFDHVVPAPEELWTGDTTDELRVPIGRTGATKLQYLAIGKDTRQHALIAGKTGSGKSTLFHVAITNLSLWCSPEQVEFYLVDFKKGVEFKCYAAKRLPHARVVAIESDREFGLSVLQRVDDELKRRGDLFRQLGVQNIPGYKKAGGTEPVPRSLLIIDEFQEFFVEDDKISQTASVLLDRIVRQGRAFGIHVLLGSQTLGGAYTVARTTLGQMVIRIALQCNEADAYLIMDDTNPAPRLLSRPGEGIYNDHAGALEGNSPFQVVWLPDEVRDSYLDQVLNRASQSPVAYPGPIVFEGNAPANVRENDLLLRLLKSESVQPKPIVRTWLGAPNSIKGPTEVVFHRQSGNNLLVVGQREEAALAILSLGLLALLAQYPRGSVRFVLLDSTPPGTAAREYLDRVVQAVPHEITVVKPTELGQVLLSLGEEIKQRSDDPQAATAPALFLCLHGLQKFKNLRYEEDFGFSADDADAAPKPGALLNTLICEGASLGFHVIATCDTYNNVNRFLSRKAISEFEMRVLFQMSANDSASLIDSPKASNLGLHRALFYNEQEGYLETFRPYALPGPDWIEEVAGNLKRLVQ